MTCSLCELKKDSIIFEGNYWTILLAKQDYLGRCIFVCKRHVDDFCNLTDFEVLEYKNLLAKYKSLLTKEFGCTMLNWCCNMNNELDNPHVHLHIRPRYKNPVSINNQTFVDNEFGKHYDRKAPIQFSERNIDYIKGFLKTKTKQYF